MKNLLFIAGLIVFNLGFAQSLPITFEDSSSTASFIDFNGGGASITANPLKVGINMSDSVAQIIRNGGDPWAGSKIVLDSNLDFSVLTKLSMKVYTTAPIGTVAKLKLEGTGAPAEVDAYTTVSGSWETLEYIFAGTPNNLNELVFMFDFGNVGNGSAASTFYFDDIQQIAGPPAPQLLSLPLDFESSEVSSDFLNYSGASGIVISNPQKSGINTSDSVAQIIRNGGDLWAGSTLLLDSIIDLTSQWHMSMKLYTTAPIGTRVKLALEGPTSSTSLDVLTTASGTWETLSWNFDGQPNDFDKLSFMFDFGNIGNGSASSTFLFDDVQQITGPALPTPVPTSLPIDFEASVMTSDFINEFGAFGSVVTNPHMSGTNTSATVGHIIKSGGAPWARTKLILTNYMDFSTLSSISMKVYTDAPVGTVLKLKVESTTSGAANERDAFTTVSGGWATYTWDFAGDPPVYNVLTFMYGYGTIGDASATSTFLIDDITQVTGPPPAPTASLPIDFEDAVNTSYFLDFDGAGAQVIGNPEKGNDNPSDSVGQIIRNGGQIWAGSKLELDQTIDFSSLGFISMRVFTQAPIGTLVKLKLEGTGGLETEVDVMTTVSGTWETLKYDFTGQPNVYNSLVFMFDFGAVGDSSQNSTFLFDDITQTNSSGNIGIETISEADRFRTFPNPAKNRLTFTSARSTIETITLIDLNGNQVAVYYPNSPDFTLDVADLSSGVYVALLTTQNGVSRIKVAIE
jgi:hypothetical protein